MNLNRIQVLVMAGLALVLAPAARAVEHDESGAEIYVLEKTTPALPYAGDGNGGNAIRMKNFLKDLPEGYKMRVRFVTRAPGGSPITYVETLTSLNKDGKPDGTELHFADWYTQPIQVVQYKNGLKDGVERMYRTKQSWNVDAKRMDTVWYVYAEIPWQNGKLNGTKKTFHATDQLESESTYQNDVLSGESRSFAEDGKLLRVARYKGGKKHGDMVDYWPRNGNIQRVVPYDTGQVNGVAREYYMNGKPKWERPFKDNLQHGIEKHYAEDGTVEKTVYWIGGEQVTEEAFKKDYKP